MTLEQIIALSPTIAALALVLSLIYASLQFRINTNCSSASTQRWRAMRA